jgi:hypothetical protein
LHGARAASNDGYEQRELFGGEFLVVVVAVVGGLTLEAEGMMGGRGHALCRRVVLLRADANYI